MHSSPVETRSITPHSQIAATSRPVRVASHCARSHRTVGEQLHRVFAHQHAEVVLRFGQQAVGVDQLEPITGLQCVPLVHVAVHEHRPLVVVRGDAARGAVERVARLRARCTGGRAPPTTG